jgi:hypothetical protein
VSRGKALVGGSGGSPRSWEHFVILRANFHQKTVVFLAQSLHLCTAKVANKLLFSAHWHQSFAQDHLKGVRGIAPWSWEHFLLFGNTFVLEIYIIFNKLAQIVHMKIAFSTQRRFWV